METLRNGGKMKERWKNDKKFRMQIILAALLLILLIGASIYTVFIKPMLSTETYIYKEEQVDRGDLILGIMESGSLSLGESSVDYDLDLEAEDEEDDEDTDEDSEDEEIHYLEIEEVYVVSGQRIKAGDPLFKLNDDSVKAVRRNLSAELAKAQITLSEAQTDYNISLLSAKSTYDSSVKAGSRAGADYQAAIFMSEAKITELEGEIKLLELEIENAQKMLADEDFLNSLTKAKTAYTQAKNRYEETDVHNSTAYVSNLSKYQQTKEALEQLEEEKKGYEDTISNNPGKIQEKQQEIDVAKISRILDNQEAENTYNSAKLEGELAQEIYDYSTEALSDTVTQAQNDFDTLQAQMDKFEAFVGEDNMIYAPENGLVTGVSYEAGDDLKTTGAMLTYSRENDYTVSIDVSEEDVAAVAVGDQVDIVFTAYPDQTWVGTITSITTSATTEYATTISYPVTIHVEGDTTLLYGGMTADVTFVTDSVKDVLYVSRKAVFEEDGKQYVYRRTSSGNREKTEVETGFSNMTSIEIKSGLSEGDTIYIRSIMNTSEEKNNSSFDGKSDSENKISERFQMIWEAADE